MYEDRYYPQMCGSEIPGNMEVVIPVLYRGLRKRMYVVTFCLSLVKFDAENIFADCTFVSERQGEDNLPLCILNPFNETKIIHPDTVVGTVDEILGVLSRVEPVGNPTEIRSSSSKPHGKDNPMADVVPKHLKPVYETSSQLLSKAEKLVFMEFLQNEETFSKDEWNLGQTDLLEHEIDTGDRKPVKQPPRRVPLALADEERDIIIILKERGIIQTSTSRFTTGVSHEEEWKS